MPPSKRKSTNPFLLIGAILILVFIIEFVTWYNNLRPQVPPWSFFIVIAAFAALACGIIYVAENYLGTHKLTPQQKTYNDRLWAATIKLQAAEEELRQARVELDLPNIQRALAHTEKALEITARRIQRLHREMAESKKNKKGNTNAHSV